MGASRITYLCSKGIRSMKNSTISFLILSICLLFFSCGKTAKEHRLKYKKISGKTMGTTYNITYSDTIHRDLKPVIDQLLVEINQEVSTYIDTSIISQFNQADLDFSLQGNLYASIYQKTKDHHFRHNFGFAKEVYKTTNGAFDPTVMPLVNYWGFGYTEKRAVKDIDSVLIDSLMAVVGFDKIQYSNSGGTNKLVKENPSVQLDFSALAKGYAVDEVARLLEKQGVKNFLVEIGGEVVCKGKNKRQEWWTIGINRPEESAQLQDLFSSISLKNQAMATSGNYRNYYKVGETSYAHTINPNTGFPEKSTLLSVTVLAESCILADAYATAFMVMGLEKSLELAEEIAGLEAYLIYSGEEGVLLSKSTSGMDAFLN